jgi:hypothetical protein
VRGAIKIKFNYLNRNLMVPEIHSFGLSLQFKSKPKVKAANIRLRAEVMRRAQHEPTAIFTRKTPGEEETQCTYQQRA